MHELLLFAPIPSPRHTHLLSILAGLTATQPTPLREKHHVYKPNRAPGTLVGGLKVGGAQDVSVGKNHVGMGGMGGDLFYVQLVAQGEVEIEVSGVI